MQAVGFVVSAWALLSVYSAAVDRQTQLRAEEQAALAYDSTLWSLRPAVTADGPFAVHVLSTDDSCGAAALKARGPNVELPERVLLTGPPVDGMAGDLRAHGYSVREVTAAEQRAQYPVPSVPFSVMVSSYNNLH